MKRFNAAGTGWESVILYGTVFVLSFVLMAGCSFSRSSRSSSQSSSASSRSSSPAGDSTGAARGTVDQANYSYRGEVEALTVLYSVSGGETESFIREISDIGRRHGINDWENFRDTYIAIGMGLKRAEIREEDIDFVPFLRRLRNSPHFSLIFTGYNTKE